MSVEHPLDRMIFTLQKDIEWMDLQKNPMNNSEHKRAKQLLTLAKFVKQSSPSPKAQSKSNNKDT